MNPLPLLHVGLFILKAAAASRSLTSPVTSRPSPPSPPEQPGSRLRMDHVQFSGLLGRVGAGREPSRPGLPGRALDVLRPDRGGPGGLSARAHRLRGLDLPLRLSEPQFARLNSGRRHRPEGMWGRLHEIRAPARARRPALGLRSVNTWAFALRASRAFSSLPTAGRRGPTALGWVAPEQPLYPEPRRHPRPRASRGPAPRTARPRGPGGQGRGPWRPPRSCWAALRQAK